MDGIATVLGWATGTLEGIAFVELLILLLMAAMYWEMRSLRKWQETHEKECAERETTVAARLAEGSTKMAVHDTKLGNIEETVGEIKTSVNDLRREK